MSYDPRSLLAFLDSPVVVGDPEGHAVYANPAFLASFADRQEQITGRPLSEFFEGGGREGVLAAVAEVCTGGRSIRFRVRHQDVGYAGLASPITSEGTQVGVLILLTEEAVGEERLLAFHREIQDPLDETMHHRGLISPLRLAQWQLRLKGAEQAVVPTLGVEVVGDEKESVSPEPKLGGQRLS